MTRPDSTILSVGIDIGTTTTQVAISRFTMANRAGLFAVPDVVITDKSLLYKSDSFLTPLAGDLLNGDALRTLVLGSIQESGYVPEEIKTGAVIVTGESLQRTNARSIVESLALLAGQFVVASAGPDMEAVIAGQGSGAAAWSERYGKCVVNVDVGGGTTSLACFDSGELIACGSFDIGGRLFIEQNGVVTRLSPTAKQLNPNLSTGETLSVSAMEAVAEQCTDVLEAALGFSTKPTAYEHLVTAGGSVFLPHRPDAIMFSGGVANYVYQPCDDLLRHHDFGVLLGQTIRKRQALQQLQWLTPLETIHATVLGAGSYTTHVSGSTVTYSAGVFPLRNLPVMQLTAAEESTIFAGDADLLASRLRWFQSQVDSPQIAIGLTGMANPPYTFIRQVADVIAASDVHSLSSPLVILLRHDMAKALGQALQLRLPEIDIICLDRLSVKTNDYIDIGEPIMDGLVVPVVIKSLIFSGGSKHAEVLHANV